MANSRYMCPEPLRALSCRKNYVTLGISFTHISEQRTSKVQTRNSSYVLQQGGIEFGVYLILASASCRVARAQYFKSDNPCRTRGTTSYRRQVDNALGVNTARCCDRKHWRCAVLIAWCRVQRSRMVSLGIMMVLQAWSFEYRERCRVGRQRTHRWLNCEKP